MFINVEITNETGDKVVEKRLSKDFANWRRIDKLLLGWIYSGISENVKDKSLVVKSLLKPGAS